MTTPITCNVQSVSSLAPCVYKIMLIPQQKFVFKAGQYALVHMGEDDKRPFSIATATHEENVVELHIGAEPSNKYAYEVLERIQRSETVQISGGYGEAYYREDNSKLNILIAGGTGFSYTYSILKEALHKNSAADITLYWGSRKQQDLYLADELTKLADQYPHFNFIPVVEFPEHAWHGRTGWVHQAVLADYSSLKDSRVYIAGRFEMAKVARDDFFAQELSQDALFGDAYAFL